MPIAVAEMMRRLAHVLFEDLLRPARDREVICRSVHDQLARELGIFELARGTTFEERCGRFLVEPYDLWNNGHRSVDYYFKTRLSLVEPVLRELERREAEGVASSQNRTGLLARLTAPTTELGEPTRLMRGISETNARFREAGVDLHYHSGVIQLGTDDITRSVLEDPFWSIVAGPIWTNVDADIKEAIDRRDNGSRDAALYAMKALESTIKIISDSKGWTKGTEKGAANYIDNLVSAKNGRFIATWEADLLKGLFMSVRNPQGHGPGKDPMPTMSPEQTTWSIETAMSWIKSLVRRS